MIAVEATARDVATDTTEVRKGILRTFLPWYPTPGTVRPISLVWLWPLADWPARSASGVLLNNRTPDEIAEGGRLDRLLNIGERFRNTVSWIADPALLQTVSDMTRGYQVLVDGQPTVAIAKPMPDAGSPPSPQRPMATPCGPSPTPMSTQPLSYARE